MSAQPRVHISRTLSLHRENAKGLYKSTPLGQLPLDTFGSVSLLPHNSQDRSSSGSMKEPITSGSPFESGQIDRLILAASYRKPASLGPRYLSYIAEDFTCDELPAPL